MRSCRPFFLAAIAALCLLALAGARLEPAAAVSSDLFISEYIEGTSNNKAIEIYNGTGAPVNLTGGGYTLQMFFNGNPAAGLTLPLTGTVASGDVHVFAQSSATQTILAQADQTNGAGWFNGDDAVVLRKGGSSGPILDVIGQIGVDPGTEWGTGLTSTADNTLRRKTAIEAGDPNGGDAFDPPIEWDGFATDTFGRLGAHPGEPAPAVLTQTPTPGTTDVPVDSAITVTFTEPVNVTAASFSISCGTTHVHEATLSGGPTTFTLDPTVDFAAGEACAITVFANSVHDQDADDPPDTMATGNHIWSFTIASATGCAVPVTHQIAQVQGSGAVSPVAGDQVRVEGVVTGDFQEAGQLGGFFFQDPTPDGDSTTSDGLFAFASEPVNTGDLVRVTGSALEFNGLTELSPVSTVDVCGSGSIGPTAYDLPRPVGATFEPVESVLVTFPEPLSATEHFQLGRFGEVTVSSDGRLLQPTDRVAPGTPAGAMLDLANRRRLLIDDGSNAQNPAFVPFLTPEAVRIGDTASGITGVMSFGFGLYRLESTTPFGFARTNPRPAAPEDVGGEIKVASFNTLNYFTTLVSQNPNARGANNATEFSRQQAKEVAAITGLDADVIGLMEVENNGSTAVSSLVDALNAATAPGTYAFISEPVVNAPNEFGGTFGDDAIKVALIYRPAVVTPVGAAQTSADDIFDRPPLIQRFRHPNGSEEFAVAVNHFKSKSCGGATGLDLDQGDGQSCFNARRVAQANKLRDVLGALALPNPLIIGDLNSYTEEDPIHVLEAAGYTGLSERFVSDERRYSFVFDGLSGELDHGLAGAGLLDNVAGASIWHINADEPLILDYNTEFNPPGLYSPNAFRSSDHDPFLLGLNLNETPTADAGGPYSVAEGASVSLAATGSDPESDALTFAWDLDDNGTFETSGQNVTFAAGTRDGPGSHTVAVRVSDGTTARVHEAAVTITNVAPQATLSSPTSSFAGFPFTLELTGASDPSAADMDAGLEYAFDCGDGAGYGAFGPASSRSCPTSSVGTRSVGAKIRDKDGSASEYPATVQVVVTFQSLCNLVRTYSSDAQVADVLCARLDLASRAPRETARDGHIGAFRSEVDAKTGTEPGKAFTAEQATILKELSTSL